MFCFPRKLFPQRFRRQHFHLGTELAQLHDEIVRRCQSVLKDRVLVVILYHTLAGVKRQRYQEVRIVRTHLDAYLLCLCLGTVDAELVLKECRRFESSGQVERLIGHRQIFHAVQSIHTRLFLFRMIFRLTYQVPPLFEDLQAVRVE